MSIELVEAVDSQSATDGSNPTRDLRYLVRGTAVFADALGEVKYNAPESFDSIPRESISLKPMVIDEGNPDVCVWEAMIHYAMSSMTGIIFATGTASFEFETGGGNQHITQALSQTNYSPVGWEVDQFAGAIGCTKDSVQGVDIVVPVYKWSETHRIPAANVTDQYKGTLYSLTGKVNNATFKACAAGECLFLGARGSMRAGGDWEIAYSFAASPNKANLQIGPITVTTKSGWDYLWVYYQQTDNGTFLRPTPLRVVVSKVYESGDFAGLGLSA